MVAAAGVPLYQTTLANLMISVDGMEANAVLYSLVQTCIANRGNIQARNRQGQNDLDQW